jgi:dihydroflavonol-4-reductase
MNLVTGATGLLGSHMLAELIRQGEKVKAYYHTDRKKAFVYNTLSLYFPKPEKIMEEIVWVQGDVLDKYSLAAAMEGVSKVYHAAGMVSLTGKSKEKMIRINIRGTANVVDACLENNVSRLCHVSSIAALGDATGGNLIDETCRLISDKKLPPYSYSKFKGEMEVWRGIHEGLRAVIVNPSVILGPGMWNSATAAFVDRVYKGLSFYPLGSVGFVDVRDVASVMVKLLNSNISGERYIINSENLTFRDFFTIIARELCKKPPAFKITPWMGSAAVITDLLQSLVTGRQRQITRSALRIAAEKTAYSNAKIKELLSVEFIPVSESVRLIAEEYLKRL